ncbi:hypothetical protein EYZ11_007720 [Aspergillus tanneri]|uniref:SET domain-containing protein n=1 Tax=Aspergillus tanneri TaxID=1220188 RepID=A0A4S3JHV8_9EURO|nr:hypothetical protein EYZ11_007720 [Aspergillus tanneri]
MPCGRPVCAPNITPSPSPDRQAQHLTPDEIDTPIAPTTRQPKTHDTNGPQKRRKVVGGLRLQTSRVQHTAAGNIDESEKSTEDEVPQKQPQKKHLVRQVHSDSRFPVRNAHKEPSVPALTSTSTDKLISGIWRQVHSEVKWSRDSLAFRIVNSMCVTYHNQSQSSRALEMVVQAYWVECYEARIVAIELEKPRLSKTEARMIALREACAVLKLTEKDLRNRLAIWRGYKEIKENGGWASLIFAGSGVYRFCKYRIGFNEGLTQRLRQLRHNLEIAADTLHPEWRQLLGVIGQRPSLQYPGHPHEWVAMGNCPAQPLRYTYRHLGQDFLHYQFIDECVVDHNVFGEEDPRRVPEVDSGICPTCHQQQADDICLNRCKCFPNLFGDVKTRPAVQVFQTGNAKNNGVVARLDFERGVAIGEEELSDIPKADG